MSPERYHDSTACDNGADTRLAANTMLAANTTPAVCTLLARHGDIKPPHNPTALCDQ